MKFKIGDRVELITDVYDCDTGWTGEVVRHCKIYDNEVLFDNGRHVCIRNTEMRILKSPPFSLKRLNELVLKELFTQPLNLSKSKLDYDLEFKEDGIHVGCNRVHKDDALKIAERIFEAYGE